MRVLAVVAATALFSTSATAGGALDSDDDCRLAIHGTFTDVADSFRRSISTPNGFLTGSCSGGDDKGDERAIYYLMLPKSGSRAFVFEGARRPECSGGGVIARIGVLRIRNDAIEVSEVSSGGLGSMRWFRWVAQTITKSPLQTVSSYEEMFRQTPSQKCDPEGQFPG